MIRTILLSAILAAYNPGPEATPAPIAPSAASQAMLAAWSFVKVNPSYAANGGTYGTTIAVRDSGNTLRALPFKADGTYDAPSGTWSAYGDGLNFTLATDYTQMPNAAFNFGSTARPKVVFPNAPANYDGAYIDYTTKSVNATTTGGIDVGGTANISVIIVAGTDGWSSAGTHARNPAVYSNADGAILGYGTGANGLVYGAYKNVGETVMYGKRGELLLEDGTPTSSRIRTLWYNQQGATVSGGCDTRKLFVNRPHGVTAASSQRLVLGNLGDLSQSHNGRIYEILLWQSATPMSDNEIWAIAQHRLAYWTVAQGVANFPMRHYLIPYGQSLMQYLDTIASSSLGAAVINASISGTTLTVNTLTSGALVQGQSLVGVNVTSGTKLGSLISGGGGAGSTWNVSVSQTAVSATVNCGGSPDYAASRIIAPQFKTLMNFGGNPTYEYQSSFPTTAIGGSSAMRLEGPLVPGPSGVPDGPGGTSWLIWDGSDLHKKFWWDQYNDIPGPILVSYVTNSASFYGAKYARTVIPFAQGEADAIGISAPADGTVTADNWRITTKKILAYIRANVLGNTSIPIVVQPLGRQTGYDAQMRALRLQQTQMASEVSGMVLGAEAYDLTRQDVVHPAAGPADPNGFDLSGARMAKACAAQFDRSIKYTGPYVSGATKGTTTVDVSIAWLSTGSGTDITPASGLVGFNISDGSGTRTITSAVRLSATVIRLTVSGAAFSGTVSVWYDPQQAALDRLFFVLDNQGLPLSPSAVITAV